jgi:hypothetical protein
VYETKTTVPRKKYFHLFPFRYRQVSLHDNVEWLISYLVCLLVNASARYSNYFKKRFVGEFVLQPRVREVKQQYFFRENYDASGQNEIITTLQLISYSCKSMTGGKYKVNPQDIMSHNSLLQFVSQILC